MYTNQKLSVRWNNSSSQKFNVSNGVKQGANLSPILFNIYTNDLLHELENSHVGCYIGNYYYGALAYADDIILLCPSVSGMKVMLNICDQYANDHGLAFNATKSECMLIQNKESNVQFQINNTSLPTVNCVKHLGYMLDKNIDGLLDLDYIIRQFNKSVNILMADFSSISSNVLIKLFLHYCTSLYGINLCDVTSKLFHRIEVAWRKSIRRVLRISPMAHCNLTYALSGQLPLKLLVLKRIFGFYCSMYYSPNIAISTLARRCLYQSYSNMGRNISYIETHYNLNNYLSNVSKNDCVNNFTNDIKKSYSLSDELSVNAMTCLELIDCRDGMSESPLTPVECNALLTVICET
jgi:hypothetical protein